MIILNNLNFLKEVRLPDVFLNNLEDIREFLSVVNINYTRIDNPALVSHDLKKVDMHVHTSFSKESIPGGKNNKSVNAMITNRGLKFVWALRKLRHPRKRIVFDKNYELGFRIKYDPKEIYDRALKNNMDYVAITDHDSIGGCLHLLDNYKECKDKLIIGEEVSTWLGRKAYGIHVGVYDINEKNFEEIEEVKSNCDELVRYLKEKKIFYVLNHMGGHNWDDLKTLNPALIRRLIELFDAFEFRNGDLNKPINQMAVMLGLMYGKKGIAGSDTHCGMVGRTYTSAYAKNKNEFMNKLRKGDCYINGEHGITATQLYQLKDMVRNSKSFYNNKEVKFSVLAKGLYKLGQRIAYRRAKYFIKLHNKSNSKNLYELYRYFYLNIAKEAMI